MYIGTSVQSPDKTIEVSVLVNGAAQSLYRRLSDGKIFVAGVPGFAYTISVRSLTGSRIEVVSTIDGRNTLKDEPGDVYANSGLVFVANSKDAITGWRISDQQTREFVFGDPARSIAAQATRGDTSNVGVIGFAVHRERPSFDLPVLRGDYGSSGAMRGATKGGSDMFGSQVTRGGSLGTSMGALREDAVGRTQFIRSGGAPDILVIGYDTEEVLLAQGIIAPPEPNAFPGAGTGYEKYTTS